ncbi:MAG: hypothetical protein HC902_00580 [Calothrix sp. SM1_5_4]|nr:hypothetical protein [Calothrix sp. SM1_5_4]
MREAGERFTASDFQGIRLPADDLSVVLEVLREQGVLCTADAAFCPNVGCGSELEVHDDGHRCDECDEALDADEIRFRLAVCAHAQT